MEINVALSEDDVEDILNAIKAYEDELMFSGDESGYIEDVLNNIEVLRAKIVEAHKKEMH